MGPLRGTNKATHGVSSCYQQPSWPILLTVAVSVPYWGHTAAVCLLVDGVTRLQLPTHPHCQPPIHAIRDITAVGKKLSQNPAVSASW